METLLVKVVLESSRLAAWTVYLQHLFAENLEAARMVDLSCFRRHSLHGRTTERMPARQRCWNSIFYVRVLEAYAAIHVFTSA